jgi:hypothetical protein
MYTKALSAILWAVTSLAIGAHLQTGPAKSAEADHPALGNEACSACHLEIYESYRSTAVARASGPALEGFMPGEFDDKVSRVHFRADEREGRVWMSYERGSDLKGTREFLHFIGSGKKGSTYLFSDVGYLFESPINWYSQENWWNMTPGYTQAGEIPMNLPAFSSCLNCHTSGMQPRMGHAKQVFGQALPARRDDV